MHAQWSAEWQSAISVETEPELWLHDIYSSYGPPHGESSSIVSVDHLNTLHSNIKFTMETERDEALPFQGVLMKRTNNDKLAHGVYRKKTHTDSYLKAASHHHPQMKRSIIQTLIHRVEIICDDESRPKELNNIKEVLAIDTGEETRHAAATRRQERSIATAAKANHYAPVPTDSGQLDVVVVEWVPLKAFLHINLHDGVFFEL
ncbi:hypothetical protein NQ318_022085 [Aromia moschata]|uniref:Helix-turn-helix domain-containing protein n=1 Tax=Aromia moschata TaxID=1265417 RepID=A0AAV8Z7F0_9CUCU|nr:hypothetical protein NQ318_022085 [Aromia moschata]